MPGFLNRQPVIPVVMIPEGADAVSLARALVRGGLRTIEITLRTPVAMEAIRKIAQEVPEAQIGAGTVLSCQQFRQAQKAGAQFIVSPGMTPDLMAEATSGKTPWLPGAITPGEMMTALSCGIDFLKFFPAEVAGGRDFLKALASPFPGIQFCPTGGVTEKNAANYLQLPNVACVGGSWITPSKLIEGGCWDKIEALARKACALGNNKEKS